MTLHSVIIATTAMAIAEPLCVHYSQLNTGGCIKGSPIEKQSNELCKFENTLLII